MTNTHCKNCNQINTGKYCTNCGQPASTHKLSLHFLWHDIQHGLLHVDKGILYTAKELFARPGPSIREFINGKRVKHFKPLSLVIILATIYGFLLHSLHINLLEDIKITNDSTGEGLNFMKKASEWMTTHYAWVTLLSLPVYTLASFLAFKKQGYNFIEHFVLNAFLTGQRLMMRIATLPLLLFFTRSHNVQGFSKLLTVVEFVLLAWGYAGFFEKMPTGKKILWIAMSFVFFFLIQGSIITIGSLIFNLVMKNH